MSETLENNFKTLLKGQISEIAERLDTLQFPIHSRVRKMMEYIHGDLTVLIQKVQWREPWKVINQIPCIIKLVSKEIMK